MNKNMSRGKDVVGLFNFLCLFTVFVAVYVANEVVLFGWLVARPSVNVTWGEISVVHAELLCIGYLLAHPGVEWKYYINLVARDMPLRTNEELVEILSAYQGANDVDGTRTV